MKHGTLLVIGICSSLSMTPVIAGDSSGKTALGSALGGGAGAAIGKQIGGNTGALIGGALGGGAGAAVTTKGKGKTGAVVGGAAAGAAAGNAMGGGTAGQAAGAALGAGAGALWGESSANSEHTPLGSTAGITADGVDRRLECNGRARRLHQQRYRCPADVFETRDSGGKTCQRT